MRVPFCDVTFDQEQIDAVTAVLKSGWPSRGRVTADFEEALGRYLNSNVLVVNSGSSALMCSLLANGVKAGDTVLVPDFTFVATASVPAMLGCKIVPVDADLETFNVSTKKGILKGKGLISTDVAGLPNNTWFPGNGGFYIEDAAESLGAEVRGWKVGRNSDVSMAVFSFQATKQLSTVEGGAIASNNEELIAKCRKIANYGRSGLGEYVHEEVGANMRTTDVASALGLIALKRLDKALDRRKHIADRYAKEIPCIPQKVPSYVTRHAYWTFMCSGLRHRERAFEEAGIGVKRAFVPMHMQPCFAGMDRGRLPNSTWLYNNLLMLPCYQEMTEPQIDEVVRVANGD